MTRRSSSRREGRSRTDPPPQPGEIADAAAKGRRSPGVLALAAPALVVLAAAAFVALTFFAVPFPAVVLGAGLVGWLLGRRLPALRAGGGGHEPGMEGPEPLVSDAALHHDLPSARRFVLVLAIGLALWAAPLVAVALLVDSTSVFLDQGLFFSGTALVTFGGAYAVLAYVAQQAVDAYGWLAPGEMVRGLALAESTPGPLIMVVQFVAFLGAFRDPGALNPWVAGVLASLLTVWVTFVPCFLFIFLGAPYVERLRGNHTLSAALTGITAAVVGVILNLAIWFGIHTIFREVRLVEWGIFSFDTPVWASINIWAMLLSGAAIIAMFRFKVGMLPTLAATSAAGIGLYALGMIG